MSDFQRDSDTKSLAAPESVPQCLELLTGKAVGIPLRRECVIKFEFLNGPSLIRLSPDRKIHDVAQPLVEAAAVVLNQPPKTIGFECATSRLYIGPGDPQCELL